MVLVSPLAPKKIAKLKPISGIRLATFGCGFRYQGRDDLLLVEMPPATSVAGVFTKSLTASAPVLWCRHALEIGSARVLLVNSGNSNAFTGKAGTASVNRCVENAALFFNCDPREVFVASTGTIGVPLDDSKITDALGRMSGNLSETNWSDAAKAIMTTDTFPKMATATAKIAGIQVTINGFAKGAGMIAPDMATLLAYVFTDAAIPSSILQKFLVKGCARSFNSITIDSDTSTSDSLMLFATGKAGNIVPKKADDSSLKSFRKALDTVLLDLALQVVRDGEGATKFLQVNVTGAAGKKAAKNIAMAIANSPLVKTALAGEDANWGRIVMAIGKSGEKADRDLLSIRIGGVPVAENGMVVPGYDETPVNAHMKGTNIIFDVDVGVGKGKATVWTCDLTHGYIDINGSYRT